MILLTGSPKKKKEISILYYRNTKIINNNFEFLNIIFIVFILLILV
jgi:hypothetical protein